MGQTSFLIPKIILLQIFLDSFKSEIFLNLCHHVSHVCVLYIDEDLLPLWLQAKTFLLSRETVRAFLSFKNRNINLDQCQSFFPLCLQLVTHVCFSLCKLKPHKNTVFGCRGAMPVEVRCYVCSYCTRAVPSIAVLWGHLLGRCAPAVRHAHHVPNQPKRNTINTCYMRDREQEPKQYLCVSTARLVPHFVLVFLLLTPQIKAALIFKLSKL